MIKMLRFHALTFGYASNEWIAGVTNQTTTYWIVIDNLTACILAARRYARINAFLIETRPILGTFWANDAFGATIWRTTNVTGQTWADNVFVYHSTLTVQAARRWIARIDWNVTCTQMTIQWMMRVWVGLWGERRKVFIRLDSDVIDWIWCVDCVWKRFAYGVVR